MQIREFRFAFHARDFNQSVQFYTRVLGPVYLSGWDRADGRGALISAGGQAVVEIHGAPRDEKYTGASPTAINLTLRVADRVEVDRWHQKLSASGAMIL